MRERDPRFTIAAFIGAAGVVLLALIAIGRFPTILPGGRSYWTAFQSVPGLSIGDEVRYGGLLVGSVRDMQIDPRAPTQILVEFAVRDDIPMRADVRATITQVGLLGEPYLNLQPGTLEAAELAPGSMIPSEESLTFQEAVSRLAVFFDRADTLLSGIERVSGTDPWMRVDRTLGRLEQLVDDASSSSGRVFTQLDTASVQLTMLLDRTDRLVAALDTSWRDAGPGLVDTQREALATLRETRELVTELRGALDAGGGVDRLVRNLADASDNIARLSARLERDPSSVLKQRAQPRKTAGPPLRE